MCGAVSCRLLISRAVDLPVAGGAAWSRVMASLPADLRPERWAAGDGAAPGVRGSGGLGCWRTPALSLSPGRSRVRLCNRRRGSLGLTRDTTWICGRSPRRTRRLRTVTSSAVRIVTAADSERRKTDDGPGVDPSDAHGGMGLQNVRDRLGALDGHVSIATAIGDGTTVSGSDPAVTRPGPSNAYVGGGVPDHRDGQHARA